MRALKQSNAWSFAFGLCGTVVVFGPSVQTLFIPKKYDVGVDFVYCVVFLFLIVDIVFLCYLDPSYGLFLCKKKSSPGGGGVDGKGGAMNLATSQHGGRFISNGSSGASTNKEEDGTEAQIRLGSFHFWVELFSVAVLLLDLSFVKFGWFTYGWWKWNHSVLIGVDAMGRHYEPLHAYTMEKGRLLRFLIIVLKTTLIARLYSPVLESIFYHIRGLFYRIQNWFLSEQKFGTLCSQRREKEGEPGWELKAESGEPLLEGSTSERGAKVGGSSSRSLSREQGSTPRHATDAVSGGGSTPRAIVQSKSSRKDSVTKKLERRMKRIKMSNPDRADVQRRPSGPRTPLSRDVYNLATTSDRHLHTTKRQGRRRGRSRVGTEMNDATYKRVAVGIMITLFAILLLSYQESDDSAFLTTLILHKNMIFLDKESGEQGGINATNTNEFQKEGLVLVDVAADTTLSNIIEFHYEGENISINSIFEDVADFRDVDFLDVTVCQQSSSSNSLCVGPSTRCQLSIRKRKKIAAALHITFTFFVMLIWFMGAVIFFAGPIGTLVVDPIERMIRLLRMITKNPLGYQDSEAYKRFVDEEESLHRSTCWGKDTLKGMET